MIYASIKCHTPDALLVDPIANPIFFVVVMTSLNAEWWSYSRLFTSLLDPIVQGIYHESNRTAIIAAERIIRLGERVPIMDLIARTCIVVIPALIGAATDNQNLLIFTYCFRPILMQCEIHCVHLNVNMGRIPCHQYYRHEISHFAFFEDWLH